MSASLVATYAAAWGELDAEARGRLLQECWAPEGVYVDPTTRAEGREGLSAYIAGFHERMPGYRIDLTTSADGHGPHLRFGWAMKRPDGSVELEGMDYAEVDDAGRLTRIVGFFGALS
jgi:SnoaL-like protein